MTNAKLIGQIKGLLKRANETAKIAEQSTKLAEDYFKRAGTLLAHLKAAKPAGIAWGNYLRDKKVGPTARWADTLIRISKGEITLAQVRKESAASSKRSWQKRRKQMNASSSHRRVKPLIDYTDREPKLSEFKRADGGIKSACNFNPLDPEDVAEPGKENTPEQIRERIFLNRCDLAIEHADECKDYSWDKATNDITEEIINGAQKVADAWAEVVKYLKQLKREGHYEKATASQALH